MAPLNGFGFSRLIKTVVPGLLLLAVLVGYLDMVMRQLGHGTPVFDWAEQRTSLAIALALPLSIFFGILSNMVVFGVGTQVVIRKPFEAANPLFSRVEHKLLEDVVALKGAQWREAVAASGTTLDLEFLLVSETELDKITFLQESYWYWLESQLNTALALALASPLAAWVGATAAHALGLGLWFDAVGGSLSLVVVVCVIAFLISTAKRNFQRHRVKRLSLLIAAAYDAHEKERRNLRGRSTGNGGRKIWNARLGRPNAVPRRPHAGAEDDELAIEG